MSEHVDAAFERPQNRGGADAHHHGSSHSHDHSHAHGHSHSHAPTDAPLRALLIVLVVTGTIFFAELIGGLITGSVALLADAMHMLSDAAGIIIAVKSLLNQNPSPTEEEIEEALSGNYCRCISHYQVIEAVQSIVKGGEQA